ncbi:hypothetical protein NBT05_11705 [Aquimarina sp. ERC-38]|uniref:hypothetical protein n=1 Tax=Aquimarina sp. ERC-38 TaxID=2949996 RepID=UPI0022460219|nr:hypothetical protein [Aquimarina sp. ERC-38]UZO79618.1 hypothetical protein NBT05_11705 [Aquimarina sp. ERC-38]
MMIIASFLLLNLNAQVILRIEPGLLLESNSNSLGLLLNIEPKVEASKNAVIGLRFGIATNPQKIRLNDNLPYFIDELNDNAVISFIPTYDYYFNTKRYRPYLGFGLGYYLFSNIDVSDRNNGSLEILEGSVKNQMGFLLRGGIEIGNIRYGLEYNFIPKATINIRNKQSVGTIDNSYLGLFIGFKIGGKRLEE